MLLIGGPDGLYWQMCQVKQTMINSGVWNPLIPNSLITQASCVLLVPGTTYFKYKLQNDPEGQKALKKSARGETWVLSLPCRTEPFPGFSSSMMGWGWCTQSHCATDYVCGQQLAPAQNEVSKEQCFLSDTGHGNVIYFHPLLSSSSVNHKNHSNTSPNAVLLYKWRWLAF